MCMHLKRKLQNWLSKIDKPTELKRHRKLTITVNDSNISLLVINTRRYKFYKNIEDLINIINLLDVINIYIEHHKKTAKYTFLSCVHRTFTKNNHILGHKTINYK